MITWLNSVSLCTQTKNTTRAEYNNSARNNYHLRKLFFSEKWCMSQNYRVVKQISHNSLSLFTPIKTDRHIIMIRTTSRCTSYHDKITVCIITITINTKIPSSVIPLCLNLPNTTWRYACACFWLKLMWWLPKLTSADFFDIGRHCFSSFFVGIVSRP